MLEIVTLMIDSQHMIYEYTQSQCGIVVQLIL